MIVEYFNTCIRKPTPQNIFKLRFTDLGNGSDYKFDSAFAEL